MLGETIDDLEAGDVFEPVRYTVTPLMVDAYAGGVEETCAWFHSADSLWGRQVRTPTMVHADKMRLLAANCPKDPGYGGPNARIHYEYHARHHSPAFVGDELVVSGRVAEKYYKRGRTYLLYEIAVHSAHGRLVTEYSDRTLLRYRRED